MMRSLILATLFALITAPALAGTDLDEEGAALAAIHARCGVEATLFDTEVFRPTVVHEQLQEGLVICENLSDSENRTLLYEGMWVSAPNVTDADITASSSSASVADTEIRPNFDGYYVVPTANGCAPAFEYPGYTVGDWQPVAEHLMCSSVARCAELAAEYGFSPDYRPAMNQMFRVMDRLFIHPEGSVFRQILVSQAGSYQHGACRHEWLSGNDATAPL